MNEIPETTIKKHQEVINNKQIFTWSARFILPDGSDNKIMFESDVSRSDNEILVLLDEIRRNLQTYFYIQRNGQW